MLPPDPSTPGAARRQVASWLEVADLGAFLEPAQLLVSELTTNAVLHAQSEIELRFRPLGAGVRIEVADRSPMAPGRRHYDDEAATGRGLELVEALSTAWGVQPEGVGKMIWFQLGSGSADEAALQPEATTDERDTVGVQLLGAPLRLRDAARQHDDALVREVSLIALHGEDQGLCQAINALSGAAERARAELFAAWTAAVDADADEGAVVDAVLDLAPDAAADADALRELLDLADHLADEDRLLTPPALPEVRAFRRWELTEVASQLRGAMPRAWHGGGAQLQGRPLLDAPADVVLDRLLDGIVVADESNRITYANPAAERLLGWGAGELVGQRLVVLIPERFRDAHLAGFTRFLLTGRGNLLGRPARVPALRRDGSEVEIELVIGHFTTDGRRSLVGSLRDISDRVRLERAAALSAHLGVVNEVAVRLGTAEHEPLEALSQSVLAVIGGRLDWEVGGVWLVDGDELCCVASWSGDERREPFLRASAGMRIPRQVGLPGRVWQSGRPEAITDVVVDDNFPRAALALEADLHGALAFPIISNGVVVGAVEFFATELREPDPDLLAALAAVGLHLGLYLGRRAVE